MAQSLQNIGEQYDWARNTRSVAQSEADVRVQFMRKVYIHLLVGIMAFAGLIWVFMSTPAIVNLSMKMGWIGAMIGLVALGFIQPRLFSSPNLKTHYIGMGLTVAFYALFMTPLFYIVNNHPSFAGDNILLRAFYLTGAVFGGLTAVVLFTKFDFSRFKGILMVASFALLAVILVSVFTGGGMGLWLTGAIIAFYGFWVLVETSTIQREFPPQAYVAGATFLIMGFLMLLYHVVILLAQLSMGDD